MAATTESFPTTIAAAPWSIDRRRSVHGAARRVNVTWHPGQSPPSPASTLPRCPTIRQTPTVMASPLDINTLLRFLSQDAKIPLPQAMGKVEQLRAAKLIT